VARYGGDEFDMVLHRAQLGGARDVLGRLREAWEATDALTTFSAGIAIHQPTKPELSPSNEPTWRSIARKPKDATVLRPRPPIPEFPLRCSPWHGRASCFRSLGMLSDTTGCARDP
jgi:hypothetical protein